MPSRILREGINRSRTISKLSEESELFYRRLMSHVDDYGRCEDDPELILLSCFPFRLGEWSIERISNCISDVSQMPYIWVSDDEQMSGTLVSRYSVAGKSYLQINNFRQQTRSKPKHPGPNDTHVNSICVAPAQKKGSAPDTDTDTITITDSSLLKKKEVEWIPFFDEWWETWPRKDSKQDAKSAYLRVVFKGEVKPEHRADLKAYPHFADRRARLMETTRLWDEREFAGREQSTIPYPATFLRRLDWLEEPVERKTVGRLESVYSQVEREMMEAQGAD